MNGAFALVKLEPEIALRPMLLSLVRALRPWSEPFFGVSFGGRE
jgi:hypothetical protein